MLVPPEVFEEEAPGNLYRANEDNTRLDFTYLICADRQDDGFYGRFVNTFNQVTFTAGGDENGIEVMSEAFDEDLIVITGMQKQMLRLALDESEVLYTAGIQVPRHYVVSELAGEVGKIVPLDEIVDKPAEHMPERIRSLLQPIPRIEVVRYAYHRGFHFLPPLKDAVDAA